MSNLHKFHVSFMTKKRAKRKDASLPIYARIKLDGIPSDLSTKEYVLEQSWCSTSQRMNLRAKDAKLINNNLEEIKEGIKRAYNELKKEGRVITALAIKLRYLKKDNPVSTLFELIQYHTKHEFSKLKKGTTKNYGSTQEYLQRFVKSEYYATDIKLAFIDYSFIIRFEDYLRVCEPIRDSKPLKNNGIMKHMERLQKLTTLAWKHGWISKNPFALYELDFHEYDSDFLEEDEIENLCKLHIPEYGISLVRDVFVFGCYTGLSFVEVKNLSKSDIVNGIDGEQWIMVRRQKSNTEVKVPLLNKALEIINNYANHPKIKDSELLLPVFCSQVVNRYLKVIAKRLGINKKLSFHVARHTFATTVTLSNDVPIETVSMMLGHKKLSTTRKYARVVEKKVSKDMTILKKKLEVKRIQSEDTNKHSHLRVV